MKPAPAFDCAICHHRIGKHTTHYLLPDQRVICIRCVVRERAWDLYTNQGSRAGIAHLLGLWP